MREEFDPPLPWTGVIPARLILFATDVRSDWIDDFGHVNNAHYLTIADHANWAFWNWVNGPNGTIESRDGAESVIVESHVRYIDELVFGQPIEIAVQLVDFDKKRYVLFSQIWKSDTNELAATTEVKFLSFDLHQRRAGSWSTRVFQRLEQIALEQAILGRPHGSGLGVSLKGSNGRGR